MIARQFIAVFVLSLRRTLRSRLVWANLGFALIPLVIVILILRFAHEPEGAGAMREKVNQIHYIYENLLRAYFLHFMVFFVANIFGFAVVRQEVDDQTLHYLFLQPLNRWQLILGKLCGYLALSSVVCIATLWLCYVILMLGWVGVGGLFEDLFQKGRCLILIQESLTLALGLMVYGSFAMLMACFFKSNVGYGVFLLCWESLLPYLPMALKQWSIMHYLHSLMPEQLPAQREFFELLGELSSFSVSLTVCFGVVLISLALSTFFFQIKECVYAES